MVKKHTKAAGVDAIEASEDREALQEILARYSTPHAAAALRRLAGFCALRGTSPLRVTVEELEQFDREPDIRSYSARRQQRTYVRALYAAAWAAGRVSAEVAAAGGVDAIE